MANNNGLGKYAESIRRTPNSVAPNRMFLVVLCFSSRAAIRAPDKDPIAKILPSAPNWSACIPNSLVAISAIKIWKFKPNVVVKKTVSITSIRSGRDLTYLKASDNLLSLAGFAVMCRSLSRRNSNVVTMNT